MPASGIAQRSVISSLFILTIASVAHCNHDCSGTGFTTERDNWTPVMRGCIAGHNMEGKAIRRANLLTCQKACEQTAGCRSINYFPKHFYFRCILVAANRATAAGAYTEPCSAEQTYGTQPHSIYYAELKGVAWKAKIDVDTPPTEPSSATATSPLVLLMVVAMCWYLYGVRLPAEVAH